MPRSTSSASSWVAIPAEASPEASAGLGATSASLASEAALASEGPEPATPQALLASFTWAKVRQDDQALAWRDGQLVRLGPVKSAG